MIWLRISSISHSHVHKRRTYWIMLFISCNNVLNILAILPTTNNSITQVYPLYKYCWSSYNVHSSEESEDRPRSSFFFLFFSSFSNSSWERLFVFLNPSLLNSCQNTSSFPISNYYSMQSVSYLYIIMWPIGSRFSLHNQSVNGVGDRFTIISI